MRNDLTTEDIKRWSQQAAFAADEKLGKDTVLLDVGALVGITDVFVITSGSNYRQVRAIIEEIQEGCFYLTAQNRKQSKDENIKKAQYGY